jgi:hypothetical protein
MSSLYLSILDSMGMPMPQFGNATEHLAGI